jgi:hypothetical protein
MKLAGRGAFSGESGPPPRISLVLDRHEENGEDRSDDQRKQAAYDGQAEG